MSTSTSTRTAHRRHSVAAQSRTSAPSSMFLSAVAAPHALRSSLLSRRTYSASRVRSFVILAFAVIGLLALSLLLRSLLFLDPPARHIDPAAHHDVFRPASRAFRYTDAASPSAHHAQPYSFAAHPADELGALVGFLAALPSNAIPADVDPGRAIDPQLVLGFDTRSGSAAVLAEVRDAVADTWARAPVVLFSELRTSRAPAAREAKAIIGALKLHPEPTVFEVDQRADSTVLWPMLQRLTGQAALPVVLIGGTPMSLEELRAARDGGRLNELVTDAGAVIDGKPKRHRRH